MHDLPPIDPSEVLTPEEISHWLKFRQICLDKGFHAPTIELCYFGPSTKGEVVWVPGNKSHTVYWPQFGGLEDPENGIRIHGRYDSAHDHGLVHREDV